MGAGMCPLAMPVTVVQPGFVNGGPKRGSEATERGEGVGERFPPPTAGDFLKFVYENGIFLHIKCHYYKSINIIIIIIVIIIITFIIINNINNDNNT